MPKHTNKQTERQTEGHIGTKTDRPLDKQTDIHTNKLIY